MKSEEEYLWDGSGAGADDVVRWEAALREYRHRPARPRAPAVRGWYAVAASVAVAALGWGWWVRSAPEFVARAEGGGAMWIDGVAVAGSRTVPAGSVVEAGDEGAWVSAGALGRLKLGPGARLRVTEIGRKRQRVFLTSGSVEAEIAAKPYAFAVETPGAIAHDMGCAYRIETDEQGRGELVVTSGWVHVRAEGRDSLVAEGFRARLRTGTGAGVPVALDASGEFRAAVEAGRLADALTRARQRDALTLLNLLWRVAPEQRADVFRTLAALGAPPAGVTLDRVMAGDWTLVGEWWPAFGYPKSVKLPLQYYEDRRGR